MARQAPEDAYGRGGAVAGRLLTTIYAEPSR